mgnify:CR=1 FL=1
MKDVASVISETPKIIDNANVFFGAITGFLALIFGEHWILFAGFLLLNIVDWLSGAFKARMLKKESSTSGYIGIIKKVWYWIVIAIAFFIAQSFVEMGEVLGIKLDFVILFGWLTLAMYIVNEIRSVLENLVEIGIEVPDFIIAGLDVTKKLMEAKEGENQCQ